MKTTTSCSRHYSALPKEESRKWTKEEREWEKVGVEEVDMAETEGCVKI